MSELTTRIGRAVDAVRATTKTSVTTGIILGTGLGGVARKIENAVAIPYADIPGFAESTVATHAGQMIIGTIAGVGVAAMEGRFHYYEGYPLDQVTFPVRVIKALGATSLIVTNACGSLNPMHRRGDIMIIDDHINLMGVNPLIGPNDETLGPRFPDMCEPYNQAYNDLALRIALENNVPAHRGVYSAMTGPCLETRAEYRMLSRLGADAIGMSTVPEVIVAVHAGLKVLGLSVLTDVCLADSLEPCKLEDIIAVANASGPLMEKVLLEFIARAGKQGML
ncbi:MAG: purine-nucleoside phosphorylase [Planctomycetaceae bacterium]|nr:purine-nucleoside phosphorylase [Planctomycetaceae bacterium]